MAWISENSITIKLQTLSFKENGCGVVDVEVTADEAKDMMELLNNRFGEKVQHPVYPHYVRGTVNGFEEVNQGADKQWLEERYGVDNWEDGWRTAYNDKSVPKSHWQTLVDALKSIATSSCCGDCEEAKRVAEVALYEAEVVHSIPVRGTSKVANDWESHYSKLYMAVSQEFHGGLSVMSPYDWDRLRKNFPEPTKV